MILDASDLQAIKAEPSHDADAPDVPLVHDSRDDFCSDQEDPWDLYAHAFDQWMRSRRGWALLTRQSYRATLRRLIQFFTHYDAGVVPDVARLIQMRVTDVRAFLAWRVQTHGVGPVAQSVALAGLKALKNFWKDQGQDPALALHLVRRPRRARTLPRPLTHTQIYRLLDHVRPKGRDWIAWRDYAMIVLLYGTGLRIAEAIGLQRQDWRRDDTLRIWGKGGQERLIPLIPVVLESLRTYLDVCPYDMSAPTAPLFWGAKGGRLQPAIVQKALRAYRDLAGLPPHATPHSLRHSFASHLLEGGAGLRDVQELLGHTSLAATQRYTQVTPAHLATLYKTAHPGMASTLATDHPGSHANPAGEKAPC